MLYLSNQFCRRSQAMNKKMALMLATMGLALSIPLAHADDMHMTPPAAAPAAASTGTMAPQEGMQKERGMQQGGDKGHMDKDKERMRRERMEHERREHREREREKMEHERREHREERRTHEGQGKRTKGGEQGQQSTGNVSGANPPVVAPASVPVVPATSGQ
jgi:hypothetical protein